MVDIYICIANPTSFTTSLLFQQTGSHRKLMELPLTISLNSCSSTGYIFIQLYSLFNIWIGLPRLIWTKYKE